MITQLSESSFQQKEIMTECLQISSKNNSQSPNSSIGSQEPGNSRKPMPGQMDQGSREAPRVNVRVPLEKEIKE